MPKLNGMLEQRHIESFNPRPVFRASGTNIEVNISLQVGAVKCSGANFCGVTEAETSAIGAAGSEIKARPT